MQWNISFILPGLLNSGKRPVANYLFGFTQYKYMYCMDIALFYPFQCDLFILIICFCSVDLVRKTNKCIKKEKILHFVGRYYNSNNNSLILLKL